MTEEEALSVASIISEIDGVALYEPIRVEQRVERGAKHARSGPSFLTITRPDRTLGSSSTIARRCRHKLIGLDARGGTLIRERLEYRLAWDVLGELADVIQGLGRGLEDALDERYLAAAREFSAP